MGYLIAIDSDGTLCHNDGSISKKTKLVIEKVKSNGNLVALCTARPRYHTLKIAKEINSLDYMISSNGSEIYNGVKKEVMWASYIDYNVCLGIYEYANFNKIRIMFVIDDTEYVTMYTRNSSQEILDNMNYLSVLKGNVKQIMAISSEKEKIKEFREYVCKEYNLGIIDYSDKNEEAWFSMISSSSSKGNALIKLADYLNISKDNIIAIGNDTNDISMLEMAGISVVVDNASDKVKKYADIIISSNEDDGVADYLNKILE